MINSDLLNNKVVGKAHIEIDIKNVTTYKYSYDITIVNPKTLQEILFSVSPALKFYLDIDKKQDFFLTCLKDSNYIMSCNININDDYDIFIQDFKKSYMSDDYLIKSADILKISK